MQVGKAGNLGAVIVLALFESTVKGPLEESQAGRALVQGDRRGHCATPLPGPLLAPRRQAQESCQVSRHVSPHRGRSGDRVQTCCLMKITYSVALGFLLVMNPS